MPGGFGGSAPAFGNSNPTGGFGNGFGGGLGGGSPSATFGQKSVLGGGGGGAAPAWGASPAPGLGGAGFGQQSALGGGGGAPAFGNGAPAFGNSAPAFGSVSTLGGGGGAAPAFGSTSKLGGAPAFGSTSTLGGASTFGGFGGTAALGNNAPKPSMPTTKVFGGGNASQGTVSFAAAAVPAAGSTNSFFNAGAPAVGSAAPGSNPFLPAAGSTNSFFNAGAPAVCSAAPASNPFLPATGSTSSFFNTGAAASGSAAPGSNLFQQPATGSTNSFFNTGAAAAGSSAPGSNPFLQPATLSVPTAAVSSSNDPKGFFASAGKKVEPLALSLAPSPAPAAKSDFFANAKPAAPQFANAPVSSSSTGTKSPTPPAVSFPSFGANAGFPALGGATSTSSSLPVPAVSLASSTDPLLSTPEKTSVAKSPVLGANSKPASGATLPFGSLSFGGLSQPTAAVSAAEPTVAKSDQAGKPVVSFSLATDAKKTADPFNLASSAAASAFSFGAAVSPKLSIVTGAEESAGSANDLKSPTATTAAAAATVATAAVAETMPLLKRAMSVAEKPASQISMLFPKAGMAAPAAAAEKPASQPLALFPKADNADSKSSASSFPAFDLSKPFFAAQPATAAVTSAPAAPAPLPEKTSLFFESQTAAKAPASAGLDSGKNVAKPVAASAWSTSSTPSLASPLAVASASAAVGSSASASLPLLQSPLAPAQFVPQYPAKLVSMPAFLVAPPTGESRPVARNSAAHAAAPKSVPDDAFAQRFGAHSVFDGVAHAAAAAASDASIGIPPQHLAMTPGGVLIALAGVGSSSSSTTTNSSSDAVSFPHLRCTNVRRVRALLEKSESAHAEATSSSSHSSSALLSARTTIIQFGGDALPFEPRQILCSASGSRVLLVGREDLAVIPLPRHRLEADFDLDLDDGNINSDRKSSASAEAAVTLTVNATLCAYFHERSRYSGGVRVVQASWHPRSDAHIVALTSDNRLLVFHVADAGGMSQPEQTFSLGGVGGGGAHTFAAFAFGSDSGFLQADDSSASATASASSSSSSSSSSLIAPSGPARGAFAFEAFTVYLLRRDGGLHSLCPVVPRGCLITGADRERLVLEAARLLRSSPAAAQSAVASWFKQCWRVPTGVVDGARRADFLEYTGGGGSDFSFFEATLQGSLRLVDAAAAAAQSQSAAASASSSTSKPSESTSASVIKPPALLPHEAPHLPNLATSLISLPFNGAGPTVLFAAWLSGHVDAMVAYPPQRPHFAGVATDGDSMQQSDGAAPLKSASLLWCGRSDANALRNPADEFVDLARDLVPCAALRAATAFREGALPLGAPLLLSGCRSDAIAGGVAADHVVHALVRSARGVHSVRCAWIARVRDLLRCAAPAPSIAAVAALLRERALFQVAEEIDWRSWMPSSTSSTWRFAPAAMIASLDGLASSRYLFAIVSDTAQRRAAVVVQALSFSVSSVPPEVSDAVSEQLKNFPKMSVIKAEIYKQMGIPPLSASDSSSDDYDFDKFARELPKLEGDGTSSQIVEQLDRFQQKIAPRYAELFAQMTRLNEHMERRRAFFQRMQTEYFNQQRAEMQETLKAAPQRLAAIRARVAALAAHRSSERAETLRRELIPLASTWLLLPTDDQMAETSQLSADVTRLRADFEHFNRRRDEKAAQQTAAARVRPAIDLSGDASQFAAASAASSLPTPSQSQRLTAQDEARLTRMVTKLDRSMSDLKAQFDLLLVRPSSDVLMLECSPLSAERSVHSSRHSVPSDESDDESSKRGEAAHADFRLSVAVAGGSENVPAPSISVEHIVRSLLPASAPAIESTHALLPAHAVAPASAAVAVSHAPALVFSPQTVRSVRTPVQLLAAAEILSARAEKPAQEPLQVHAALLVASPNPAAVASAASPAPHSRLSLQPLFSPLAHFPGQHRAAAVASAFANSGSDPATPVRPAKAAASALTPNVVTPSATKSVVKEGLLSGRKVLRNPLAFLNQTRDGVATASRLSAVSADEQGAGALVSPLATSHAAATSGKAAGESSAVEEASIRGATPVFPTPTSSRGPMTPLPIPLLTKPAVAPHSAFFFSPARSAQKAGK